MGAPFPPPFGSRLAMSSLAFAAALLAALPQPSLLNVSAPLPVSEPDKLRLDRITQLKTFFDSVPEEESCFRETEDEFKFYCPTPEVGSDGTLRYQCISGDQLCNLSPDCPYAEDEDLHICMFYKSLKHQLRRLRKTVAEHYAREHVSRGRRRRRR